MARVITVNDVLDGHVTLDIECLDRIYLNAYVPILQTSSQVVAFLSGHLGFPFPSPALFRQMGDRFRKAVLSFSDANDIPWVKFEQGRGQAGGDAAAPGAAGSDRTVRGRGDRRGPGVPAGVDRLGGQDLHRDAAVVVLQGRPAGDLLLLLSLGRRTSARHSSRCAPGSRIQPRSGSTGMSGSSGRPRRPGSGSPRCPTGSPPARTRAALQAICDRLGPGTINVFAQRWLHRLPLPFGPKDHDAGYWWETLDAAGGDLPHHRLRRAAPCPRLLRGAGRRQPRHRPAAQRGDHLRPQDPPRHQGVFRTAIDRRDNGGVLVNVFYKHSRIKQYLKDGRAMRIETVVNAPRDLGCNARLPNLDELQARARAANRRILDAERAGQGTVLASPAFERVAHPSVDAEGRRTPALRFGDPRVMALAGALCQTLLAATGFTNKNLRVLIAGLLGSSYTPGQMTYDLRRLRLGGLIRRLPHTNRYTLTEDGIRIAVFYTKIYNRLLVPLTAANQPQAPPELRAALAAITRHVDDYADRARLPRAA